MAMGAQEDHHGGRRICSGGAMAQIEVVQHDQGGVNARILARESKADFRRVEAASLKMPTRFASPDGKRAFVRYFNTFQLGSHFVSVIARTKLDPAEVTKAEGALRAQLDRLAAQMDEALDAAEARFQAHGITVTATYDTVPMQLDVGVLSSTGRRYLEILGKLDQLMPLLQTLEIHEVGTAEEIDHQRAVLKRLVRDVANQARSQASRLRTKMNGLDRNAQAAGRRDDREGDAPDRADAATGFADGEKAAADAVRDVPQNAAAASEQGAAASV
jgi:hypothetical protein